MRQYRKLVKLPDYTTAEPAQKKETLYLSREELIDVVKYYMDGFHTDDLAKALEVRKNTISSAKRGENMGLALRILKLTAGATAEPVYRVVFPDH